MPLGAVSARAHYWDAAALPFHSNSHVPKGVAIFPQLQPNAHHAAQAAICNTTFTIGSSEKSGHRSAYNLWHDTPRHDATLVASKHIDRARQAESWFAQPSAQRVATAFGGHGTSPSGDPAEELAHAQAGFKACFMALMAASAATINSWVNYKLEKEHYEH